MGNYFSKQSTTNREPIMNYYIQRLLRRFEQSQKTGECITLNNAFAAMTGDIITKYAYGKDFGYLEDNDYKAKWKAAVSGSLKTGVLFRHCPFLDLYKFLPSTLVQVVSPGIGEILFIEDLIRKQVERLLSTTKDAKAESTIFDALLDPAVPAEEKTADRLTDQGHMLLVAGTETTANTLTTIAFHLLKNPRLLADLREEQKVAMSAPGSPLTWSSLEKLPFLVKLTIEDKL